ncbi:MAG TPA: hypothetical protein VME01_00075 [Solirubrobacteraceae bacterium]|nr:hypothetical protein [Solirubrobacteraceae bacterium]
MPDAAVTRLLEAIRGWREANEAAAVVVAIDGHGAAGKSTLAQALARESGATLVHMDDFFHAARPTDDPRPMARYYDWDGLRSRALAPRISAGALILVEGVSSSGPALADLVTHTVLVDTPQAIRLERLRALYTAAEWDHDWLAAEEDYFATRPATAFDLVVSGAGAA